jgi:chloride channel 7
MDDPFHDDDAPPLSPFFRGHQFDCPPGQINELADIFFGSRVQAITRILTSPDHFSYGTLLAVGLVFFLLMTLTLGVALPVGLFMPTFLVGTSSGAAAGMLFQKWISSELEPTTFSLLGAAALLAGIQHSPVSLCVILVEGKFQTCLLLFLLPCVLFTGCISTHYRHWSSKSSSSSHYCRCDVSLYIRSHYRAWYL